MSRGHKKCRKWLEYVAQLPCSVCGCEPVQVHHIRKAPLTGAGAKASDFFTMPLCPACHESYHRNPKGWEMANGEQVAHVEETIFAVIDRLAK